MHQKSDILLKWHLDTIDFYFDRGLKFFEEIIESADNSMELPNLSKRDLAIGSFQYFRQSVLYELNALVEHYFQLSAAKNDEFLLSNSNLKISRSESVNAILAKYTIDIQDLPSYPCIKELYSTVNSLKHRGSFEFTDFSGQFPEIKMAQSDIETLKRLKSGTSDFLFALVNSILIIEDK